MENLTRHLRNKQSIGWDELTSDRIKQCQGQILLPITELGNMSIEERIFPRLTKNGHS